MESQYSNVMKALQGMQSAGGLTYEQQSENYNAFSDLMRKGVYIPDLLRRIDELESEVKALEARPGRDADADLLAVMESAVHDDAEVVDARRRLSDLREAIITEMCLKDPRYSQASESYRTTVNRVYVAQREGRDGAVERVSEEVQASDGADAPLVRDHARRRKTHQKGVQDDAEGLQERRGAVKVITPHASRCSPVAPLRG